MHAANSTPETQLAAATARVVEGGLPLAEGLRAYAGDLPQSRARVVIQDVAAAVERGEPLVDSVAQHGGGDPFSTALLAGIQTNRFEETLAEYIRCVSRQEQLRRSFWAAWMCPLVFWVCRLALAWALLYFVVPLFKELFEDFGVQVPWYTLVLLKISDVAIAVTPAILPLLALVVLVILLRRRLPGYECFRELLQRLPIVGPALQMRGAAEWCSWMALFMEAQTPLPDALEATARVVRDPVAAAASMTLAGNVRMGESLESAVASERRFPVQIRHVCHWEGRGTAFAEILRETAGALTVNHTGRLDFIVTLLSMFSMVQIGIAAVFVLFALFGPLFQMVNMLS